MGFPADFVWGSATSSYQIEGGAFEDGKGLSVWDVFCQKENTIWRSQTGEFACDHYHRYKEDVALMKELGLKAYRFSINWPRVLPRGTGKINTKGIDFYSRLVDELLKAGIEPWLTLFHWEFPQELFYKGGWMNPDSPDWFAEYAQVVTTHLSDRVTHWITLNEPQCFIELGYDIALHAPGVKLHQKELLLAGHHILISHGKAVQVIRALAKKPCKIGMAPAGFPRIPATNSMDDIKTAYEVTFSVPKPDGWNITWWLDPVFFGNYPEDGLEIFAQYLPPVHPDDMKTICQPLDFSGMNIYTGHYVKKGENGMPVEMPDKPGCDITMLYWPVVPEVLYWAPRFLYERYKLPIVITENGMSNTDWVFQDGKVHDPQRIDFMHRYLKEFARAGDDGVDIMGYFHWTFMDNFEWAWGYRERLGLVHVDFKSFKRTPKDSAYWYRDVIATNGDSLFSDK
ncbi:MAG: beta-glucosidase [Spirochaetales bacterium]|nr:beta-glucosidase [Spirochaetales bacterium]